MLRGLVANKIVDNREHSPSMQLLSHSHLNNDFVFLINILMVKNQRYDQSSANPVSLPSHHQSICGSRGGPLIMNTKMANHRNRY